MVKARVKPRTVNQKIIASILVTVVIVACWNMYRADVPSPKITRTFGGTRSERRPVTTLRMPMTTAEGMRIQAACSGV